MSQLLDERQLGHQKITLDALYMIPLTLRSIHTATGLYVVGLKANQATLYRQCVCHALFDRADYEQVDPEKKQHGRLEQRTYQCYSLESLRLAPRWQSTGLATLIRVERNRQQGDVVSQEVRYFGSNVKPASAPQVAELFAAVRHHWRVEVMHHQRDVTLAEDALRTAKACVSRFLGSLGTLVMNLLGGAKVKNKAAQLDAFADKFSILIQFFTQQMVL